MKNIPIRLILFILLACCLTAASVLYLVRLSHKKIAMVDAVQLFNQFTMKQELEAQAAVVLKQLNQETDSLKSLIAVQSKAPNVAPEGMAPIYRALQEAELRFQQAFQQSNQRINEQVWSRLNPLIDAYGKQHKLRLIIGANGMGSVLYYNEFYDITQDVIDYINIRYEEGN